MNFWQLKVFASVVENKSFSKASQTVSLSQPTISTHIKELESYFDCRLLDRMGKQTEPTKAGSILYGHAKHILTLMQTAESEVHDFLGITQGNLMIGGSTIPSGFILPKLIRPFNLKYPGISLSLTSGNSKQIIHQVKAGRIDVGVVGGTLKDPDIHQEDLLPDQMKLITPFNHPLAEFETVRFKDLCSYPMIARENGSGSWQSVMASIAKSGLNHKNLHIAVTMGDTISVIQGIMNGIGISILSTLAVQSEIDQKKLAALSIDGLDLTRSFYLTLPARRSLSPIAKKFVDFIKHPDKKAIPNNSRQQHPADFQNLG